jgi:ornithine cyclodeaminase
LTALRTGAAAGVATDILAVSDASRLAVIGAGGQSADQVRAVCAVRPIKEVRVAARTAENAERVVNRLRSELPNVNLLAAASNAEAIRSADVVCTVTDATSPLFSSNDLDPNAHVNAMGAFTPAMCELPPELLSSAWVVAIDEIAAAKEEAGDLLQAISAEQLTWDAVVEIGKIRKRGRPDGRSVFKSVGIAAQDLLVAQLAVTRARQADTGRGARAAVEP